MYKLNFDSQEFTRALKSHAFETVFKVQDSPYKEIEELKLTLNESILRAYDINGEIRFTIFVDRYFFIRHEDLSTYELKIAFKQDGEFSEIKLSANSLSTFTEWKQAFLVTKRPNQANLSNCFSCKEKFYFFRRKVFCKYCG